MGLDPQYLVDNSDVIWYGTSGYQDALGALSQVWGKTNSQVEVLLNGKYGKADFWTATQALKDSGVIQAYNSNGNRCFAYATSEFATVPTGPAYQIDSNAMATTQVSAAPAFDVIEDVDPTSTTYQKMKVTPVGESLPTTHNFHDWKFFATEAIQGVSAAATGITLGKIFDSALYNLNPDFFDSHGMSSLNPETWNSITNGDDSFAAGLFNMIFGLNPDNGKGQLFMDENAFAYLALWLKSVGAFNQPQGQVINPSVDISPIQSPFNFSDSPLTIVIKPQPNSQVSQYYTISLSGVGTSPIYYTWFATNTSSNYYRKTFCLACSKEPFTYYAGYNTPSPSPSQASSTTINGHTIYYGSAGTAMSSYEYITPSMNELYAYNTLPSTLGNWAKNVCYTMLFDGQISQPIEGISDQPNARLPDVSGWTTPQDTLPSLRQQYPELWDNAVPNTITQPDGTQKVMTYIPVATPNANSQWDTQPTTGTSTQALPQIQPQTNPTPENNDMLRLLLQLLTMPDTQPDTETETLPQPHPNIPTGTTTGTGDSPEPVGPVGEASALWSVYHPTQAQVNDFGAWLWGSPFLTNIGKLFSNPIEGVISLHKVFAPPVDSGSGTIVVGTLDSGVGSATVNQQYVEVDCGSISCMEHFGTVFDYPPFTETLLYLPFIGIVPLDTNDVMRSTIHVKYGVDIFTGACLAMVEVTRDNATVNMYQYAGSASVEYPLSNVQNGQLLAGILSAGAGIASIVVTGGVSAPAVGGIIGGVASAAKSNVGHSGGFSGNAGAMGIKNPYLIIRRPQVKTADMFPTLEGYPTNYSCKLGDCSGHVVVKSVHVEGMNATDNELSQIETLLKDGILI